MHNNIDLNTNNPLNKNYSKSLLGATFKLNLNHFQATRINQFLGCVRQVKNQKIAQINDHNKNSLQTDLYNEFKATHPELTNPYSYKFPDQAYAHLKESIIDFVGPLTTEMYLSIYQNNKHYLERTPSVFYRNSLKDLLDGNKKYIADVFNQNINYLNKRKPLKFIKKNDGTESFLVTKSDSMFQIKNNTICFGTLFEKTSLIEEEITELKHEFKNHLLSNEDRNLIQKRIGQLQKKIDKDSSYLGVLKFFPNKKNKTSKEIDLTTVNSIRIKRDKGKYFISFTYEYINEYQPCLFRMDNGQEITTKEELSLYIHELSKANPKLALKYLKERVLGIDRGVRERLALGDNKENSENIAENKDNFISYSKELLLEMEKLAKQINYHNRQLKRRTNGSLGYKKAHSRLRKLHGKLANIKQHENHVASHKIIKDTDYPIIALEKLNLKGMTKRAIPKVNINKTLNNKQNILLNINQETVDNLIKKLAEYYKENKGGLKYKEIIGDYKIIFNKNKAVQKSGLNKALLNQNHGQFGVFLDYKAQMHGKVVIEVPAAYSSQECSKCGNINKENRTKTKFCCKGCGYKDHADSNASKVIAGRVYRELLKLADKAIKKAAKESKELTETS